MGISSDGDAGTNNPYWVASLSTAAYSATLHVMMRGIPGGHQIEAGCG
jgi:hypothetical protein